MSGIQGISNLPSQAIYNQPEFMSLNQAQPSFSIAQGLGQDSSFAAQGQGGLGQMGQFGQMGQLGMIANTIASAVTQAVTQVVSMFLDRLGIGGNAAANAGSPAAGSAPAELGGVASITQTPEVAEIAAGEATSVATSDDSSNGFNILNFFSNTIDKATDWLGGIAKEWGGNLLDKASSWLGGLF